MLSQIAAIMTKVLWDLVRAFVLVMPYIFGTVVTLSHPTKFPQLALRYDKIKLPCNNYTHLTLSVDDCWAIVRLLTAFIVVWSALTVWVDNEKVLKCRFTKKSKKLPNYATAERLYEQLQRN